MQKISAYEELLEHAKNLLDSEFKHAVDNSHDYDHDNAVISVIGDMWLVLDTRARFVWANDYENDLRFIELQELRLAPVLTLHSLIVQAVAARLEEDLFNYSPACE